MDAGRPFTVQDAAGPAVALARSAVYRFLSLAFLPPAEELSVLRSEGTALLRALDGLRAAEGDATRGSVVAGDLLASLGNTDGPALRAHYHQVFGHQACADCPLYETPYVAAEIFQQAQQLADIAGFYRAFGLEVAEEAGERLDHASLELEFMGALAYREAYALVHHGPAEVTLLQEAQRAFLRDHLARWVPLLARLVRRRAEGFYRHLADLAEAWIAGEAAAFGVATADATGVSLPGAGMTLPTQDPQVQPVMCTGERCPLDDLP